jgi:predicted RNase H-like HicB family nuclease
MKRNGYILKVNSRKHEIELQTIHMTMNRIMNKMLQLTAVIEREGDGYVATCPELDVVSQGGTVEAARLNLLEAVEGFFEVASPSEIRRRLKKETYVMPIMPTLSSFRVRQAARLKSA